MSSTSVYQPNGSIVTEDTMIDKNERAQALQQNRVMITLTPVMFT